MKKRLKNNQLCDIFYIIATVTFCIKKSVYLKTERVNTMKNLLKTVRAIITIVIIIAIVCLVCFGIMSFIMSHLWEIKMILGGLAVLMGIWEIFLIFLLIHNCVSDYDEML